MIKRLLTVVFAALMFVSVLMASGAATVSDDLRDAVASQQHTQIQNNG